MRGGDISNEQAPQIGIRFERVIKTDEGKLNRAAKAFIQSLMRSDVSVSVVTTGDRRSALAFMVKWGIPYNHLYDCTIYEVPAIAVENEFLTYYDLDQTTIQNVISRGKHQVEGKLWTSVVL